MVARVGSEAGKAEAYPTALERERDVVVPDRGAENRSLWLRVVNPLRLFAAR